MYLMLSVIVVFALLCIAEIGWRKQWFNNEIGRKFVHVLAGSFVAFWPFFLSWNQIRLLSVAFMLGVGVSYTFKIFRAIHSVQRPTFGEICFAATVGLLTFITHSKGIYAVALLQMSLADGFAAVFGSRYGRNNAYRLLGHSKSMVGTATFVITSLALLTGYGLLSVEGLTAPAVIGIALVAAAIENIIPLGFDNLAVPLFVGLVLANL